MASGVSSANADSTAAKESKIPISKQSGISKNVQESATMKKPPFESRKSGEELKLELATAVSAKIANGGGRNSSSNINSAIGYLLQRREAEESKLNTKDKSFQKDAVRKVATDGKSSELKSIRSGMSKSELQKTLLSALMSSRAPSGSGQTKHKTAKSTENDKNEKLVMINDKKNANSSSNTILNITKSLQETSGIEEPETSNDESKKDLSSTNTVGLKKQHEQEKTENTVLQNNVNDSAKVNSTKTSGIVQLVKRFEKERMINSENGSLSKTATTTGKLDQNDIKKKIPPPVAKKPVKKSTQPLKESTSSKNAQQTAPKDGLNTNTHSSTQHLLIESNTSHILREATSASNAGAVVPEELLEKLEERIGSCKISVFKSTDEFSALRMKVHRIRGSLDQLRRDREKRTILV